MSMPAGITAKKISRMQSILGTVADYQRRGYTPSVREIGAAIGLNYSTVSTYIADLVEQGWLEKPAGKRALILLRPGIPYTPPQINNGKG